MSLAPSEEIEQSEFVSILVSAPLYIYIYILMQEPVDTDFLKGAIISIELAFDTELLFQWQQIN